MSPIHLSDSRPSLSDVLCQTCFRCGERKLAAEQIDGERARLQIYCGSCRFTYIPSPETLLPEKIIVPIPKDTYMAKRIVLPFPVEPGTLQMYRTFKRKSGRVQIGFDYMTGDMGSNLRGTSAAIIGKIMYAEGQVIFLELPKSDIELRYTVWKSLPIQKKDVEESPQEPIKPPRLKRDWEGYRVKSKVPLQNAGCVFAVGTEFLVEGWKKGTTKKHSGLELLADPCHRCGKQMRIIRVSPEEVEIIAAPTDVYTEIHKNAQKPTLKAPRLRDGGMYVPEVELLLAKRRQVIMAQFTSRPPVLEWCFSDCISTDEEKEALQNFVINNLKEPFAYATATDTIEAAFQIAESQLKNGGRRHRTDGEASGIAWRAGYRTPYNEDGNKR